MWQTLITDSPGPDPASSTGRWRRSWSTGGGSATAVARTTGADPGGAAYAAGGSVAAAACAVGADSVGVAYAAGGSVTAVACAVGADLIAVACRGGRLRLHRGSGELVAECGTERRADLMELAFACHMGRPYVASLDRGNVLQLWDATDATPLTALKLTGRRGANLALLSIGGRLIASITGDRWRGVLIDLASGRKTARDEFDGHPVTYLNGDPVTVTADPGGDLRITPAGAPDPAAPFSAAPPARLPVAPLPATPAARLPAAPLPVAPAAPFPATPAGAGCLPVAVSAGAASVTAGPTDGVTFDGTPPVATSAPAARSTPVVCFQAGGRLLAAVVHNHDVVIWDVAERQPLESLQVGTPVTGLAATSLGDLVILAAGEAVFMAYRPHSDAVDQPSTETVSTESAASGFL
ncbi:hypothetical protein Aph02nite_28110 [Actinoplanes philippinensis]|uniref:Uncharacterized protein n=1 Tax=Actinoplanes philippinensis TaxID=35752 RepID=A0A1I2GCX6_9ACTN|nr:hypothetical protein [Actinoplanes philippinensis]GIE76861.1 hypothetical protein Aph02nite_28110 [Actinoplanes philippinensis]SFF15604.1 hypothetical protein SAMN05421541_106466 [Actinoplanes philippinensis]